MYLTQDNNDVITSVIENITNIDATTKQNRAIRLAVIQNNFSIFTPFRFQIPIEYRESIKFQVCNYYS